MGNSSRNSIAIGFLYTVYYHTVCLVYLGCLDGGKVNLCGHFRVVPHGTGYDARGDMVRLGDACPTVACYIQRKGKRQVEFIRQFLQMPVYPLRIVAVLRMLSAVLPFDDRKEVLRSCFFIFP